MRRRMVDDVRTTRPESTDANDGVISAPKYWNPRRQTGGGGDDSAQEAMALAFRTEEERCQDDRGRDVR
jgi:hypothetical protein